MADHGLAGSRPRVVVVGGGFGGLAAVRRLQKAAVAVTLVDRTNHHLFQPLLYQVATGVLSPGEVAPPLRVITHHQQNVAVRLAEATGIDVERKEIRLRGADGGAEDLGYDYLIVAAGARDSYFGHDDWAPYLYPMKTLAQAVALRDQLLTAYERAAGTSDLRDQEKWTTFAIVGGGPTGVEVAGQLSAMAREFQRDFHHLQTDRARIVIVEAGPDLLGPFSPTLRRHAQQKLTAMGVQVRLGTKAVHVDGNGITVAAADGAPEQIAAGTVVWAAGVKPSPLAAMLGDATGASVDHHARIEVGPDCSVGDHQDLFAIGDMANLDDLPGLAEPAMQEGWYVAKKIHHHLSGRAQPGPFRYRDLGTMATISSADAVAEAFGLRLAGRPAKLAWAGVHLAFLAGWGNRGGVLARWAYEAATHNRSERVILEGLGADDGLLDRLGRSDEPGPEDAADRT